MFPPSSASRYGGQSRTAPATIGPNPSRRAEKIGHPGQEDRPGDGHQGSRQEGQRRDERKDERRVEERQVGPLGAENALAG